MRILLPEYQLGGLSPRLRRSVEQHLATCVSCAEELKALEVADTRLFSTLREEAPPDLWARIEPHLKAPQPKRTYLLRYAWAPVGVAALAAVVWLMWPRVVLTPTELVEEDFEVGYERQHAYLGWNDPLADRVHLGLVGLEATDGDAP
jgi:anti-sigma factor RsiW